METPVDGWPPALDHRPREERGGILGMGGVFRHLCWYVHRVALSPPADIQMQSLIDLAGSEKATSDKERTREGKYINTRLVPPPLNAHEPSRPLTASTRSIVKFTQVGKRDFYLGRGRLQGQKVMLLGSICSGTLADEDTHQ